MTEPNFGLKNNKFYFKYKSKFRTRHIKSNIHHPNFYTFLYKIKKHLTRDLLIEFVDVYNQNVEKHKKIAIYHIDKLEFHEIYILCIFLLKYPKLINVQQYFEENFILYNLNSIRKFDNSPLDIYGKTFSLRQFKKKVNNFEFHHQYFFEESKIDKMFGLTKGTLKLIKQKVNDINDSQYHLYRESISVFTLREMDKSLGTKNFNNLLALIKPNQIKNFHDYYHFIYNLKKHNISTNEIIEYLFYLRKHYEKKNIRFNVRGILRYYDDYLKMKKHVEKETGTTLTNFKIKPSNVRESHDELLKIYNELNSEKDKKIVLIEYYRKMNLSSMNINDSYLIKEPETALEVKLEGKLLNHCVGTYINNILKEQSLIYFLRNKEDDTKQLVTIEVSPNSRRIVQMKGKHNRKVTREEYKAISIWAANNNLLLK